MSAINRTALKAEFQTGNQATAAYFTDLIDSSFNKVDDNLLLGPVGLSDNWGVFISSTGPTFNNSVGQTGQMAFSQSGATASLFIHNGTQWFKFTGTGTF